MVIVQVNRTAADDVAAAARAALHPGRNFCLVWDRGGYRFVPFHTALGIRRRRIPQLPGCSTGKLREPLGKLVGGIRGIAHLEQREPGDVEPGRPGAAVDQHGDARRLAAGLRMMSEAFLHAAAPRVTTSSATSTRSPAPMRNPRRSTSALFSFSAKRNRTRACRASSWPITSPPMAGASTVWKRCRRQLREQQGGQPLDLRHVLADLRALEIVGAVQPGAQHEMPLQQRPRAGEDVDDLLLDGIHVGPQRWRNRPPTTKPFFLRHRFAGNSTREARTRDNLGLFRDSGFENRISAAGCAAAVLRFSSGWIRAIRVQYWLSAPCPPFLLKTNSATSSTRPCVAQGSTRSSSLRAPGCRWTGSATPRTTVTRG